MRILMLNYEYPPLGGGGSNACMKEIKSYPVDPVDPVDPVKEHDTLFPVITSLCGSFF